MKEYTFRYDNKSNWEGQRQAIGTTLKAIFTSAKGDFVVKIEDYKESSPKALRGYFRLIGIIKNYVNSVNNENWTDEEMSNHFKLLAGYSFEFDMMPIWKMQYRYELNSGSEIVQGIDGWHLFGNKYLSGIPLGQRFIKKPKSLKRKHGCTYEDMSRLIERLIDFGSEIPGCILTTPEKAEFKKYYGVK